MNRKTIINIIQKILLILFISASFYSIIPQLMRNESISNLIERFYPKPEVDSIDLKLTYGRFLDYLELGWVKQVDLYDNGRNAKVITSSPDLGIGNRPVSIRVEIPVGASQLIQKLKDYNIDFDAHPTPRKSFILMLLRSLIVPSVIILGLAFFFQNSDNENSRIDSDFEPDFSFEVDLDDLSPAFDPFDRDTILFSEIAGIDEAKAEFEEIVSFLNEPERYTLVGAKIPKGVLLVGPPGTGKTLLAKAIANEAGVPFYSVAGSEFVEMFIGMGASRIRELFERASENAPCIVFIDEIDAVGRERGAGVGGGNDEREQTLNQLLTEMDGFKENRGVIVIGATNRVDILDGALLRPGRFDRQITVGLPDRLGRLGILKVHAQNKPLDKDVSLVQLANRTPGFSGADLANLLNESAILATRYKKSTISKNEVNEAADRIIGGIAGSPMENTKSKKLIAYHEVGHAIVGSLLEHHDEVEKVTLIPRGGAKGLTWFVPEEDATLVSRVELLARIMTTLGGRVAERIVFGDQEITTGASNDLQQVTKIARQMVTKYGMSSIGPMAIDTSSSEQVYLGGERKALRDRVDTEVRNIVNYCERIATKIVLDNRVIIDLIVEKLLESETINGEEFRELVQKYTIPPVKNL